MENETTNVVLLGTGTPFANPQRSGPSVAIVVNDIPYIVDFGPGVVRRAASAFESGVKGLKVDGLKRAFLTHLHSDHTTGYPDLIFTPWTVGRKVKLEVYGPPGTDNMTRNILKAYQADIDERLQGLEPANESGFQVECHEIDAGEIYHDSNVCVHAFPVDHGSWKAYGYKFTTPDKTIVISGDTTACENIVYWSRDCDILIHEVYSVKGFEKRSSKWQKYHSSVHTSSKELAEIASKVNPKLLILYHQLFFGASEDDLLLEVKQGYSGNIVSGKDLDIY